MIWTCTEESGHIRQRILKVEIPGRSKSVFLGHIFSKFDVVIMCVPHKNRRVRDYGTRFNLNLQLQDDGVRNSKTEAFK